SKVEAMTDIVEAVKLDHHVMHRALARRHQGEAVMARIDVEEIGLERIVIEIAQTEAQRIAIEGERLARALDVQHHMTEAERAGAEAGDVATGHEGIASRLGPMANLHPVAERVPRHDEVGDGALACQRTR